MDLTWNIDNIYTSFTCDEFLGDVSKFEKYIDRINVFSTEKLDNSSNVSKSIETFLDINNKYEALKMKLSAFAEIRSVVNVKDDEAAQMLDFIEDKDSEHKKAIITFIRWLKGIENLDEIVNSNEYILDHKFYLNELMSKSRYLLSDKEEVIISKMQNIGSRSWQRYYMELIADSNLGELCSLVNDNSLKVREKAFYKLFEKSKDISKQCAKCINGIAGEVNIICDMRGYKSPLEKVLIDSRMDIETLNVMIQAIEESLPMFHKYYREKASILSVKHALPSYDMYVSVNDSDKHISYEECRDIIVSSFNEFSEMLGSFADNAFKCRWIDAKPSREKGDFGIQIDIFPLKESRISVNFKNSIMDVGVIAHEIGHAYHSSKLYRETMLNTYYGTPLAETASIFCETLISDKLIKSAQKDEKLALLERRISDAAYFVVEFYVRFLFEKELYERRAKGLLSVDELNDMMVKYMKKVYGDSIDEKTINPYMWLNKVGYFMPGDEFLNFPYSFGILFAKGIYNEYLKRGQSFVSYYDEFLSSTSRNSIVDAAKLINIDVHDINFWRSSLKIIEEDIEEFINY